MRYLLLLFTVFCLNSTNAQWSWPVQVNAFTTGPYFNYLSYYSDQNDHLQILVALTDQNATTVPAKLHFRIEGAGWWVETNDANGIPPLYLEPFAPNVISGIQLQPYLLESNLIKSDASLDLNNLPEGFTEICVEVQGVGGTLTTIGGNQCTPFWLTRYQPPQAFIPQCGSQLDTTSMFQTFSWTVPAGYTPFVNPTAEIEYTFSLYEWVDQNNYSIFQTGQGLVYQNTVSNIEQLLINDFEVQWQQGMDYVWRVQANLYSNGMPIDMFENNGLSEICTFTYGESKTLEEQLTEGLYIDLTAFANTQYKGSANWTVTDQVPGGLSQFSSYFLEYRLKPDSEHPNPIWHYDTVVANAKPLYQLSPERTYQVRVSGMAGTFTSDPTPIVEFTTPAAIDYACGDVQIPFRPNSVIPNTNVIAGDRVQIGQFQMTINEAIPQYEQGRYAGSGTIPIEFLGGARAKVTFDNILVDKDYVVHDGRVDVTTDGVEAWLHEQMQDFVDPIYVDGTVDSAWVDTTAGVAWVIVDGVSQQFVFDPPSYPIVIHDNSGLAWTIYPNGTISVEGYLNPSNDNLDVAAADAVNFQQNPNETFGFDGKEHMEWHENYEIIELSDSTYYFVANKSIGKDQTDAVDIVIPSGVSPTFKLNDQTDLTASSVGTIYTVQIPAISSSGNTELYVYNSLNERIGKLNIFVYNEKEKKVIVVPIANASIDSIQLKNELHATLGEANVSFDVTVAPQWNNATFSNTTTIVLPEMTSLMTSYSQDMRDLRDAYFTDTSTQKNNNAYYLFVIPQFDDPNADGYMVRGKGLGFIKAGSNYLTYAHELAHGIGALEHSWKYNGPEQGTTNNLMDYVNNAENLTKAQWKELRAANLIPGLLDDIEDGSSVTLSIADIPDWMRNADSTLSFFATNGEVITLPKNTVNVTFSTSDPLKQIENENYTGEGVPIGTLTKFKIAENNTEIEFKIQVIGGNSSYSNETFNIVQGTSVSASGNITTIPSNDWTSLMPDWPRYFDTITKNLATPAPILGLAYYEDGEIKFQLYSFIRTSYNETTVRDFWSVNSDAFFAIDYSRDDSEPTVDASWLAAGDYYADYFQNLQGTGVKISSGINASEISPKALEYLEEFKEWAGPNVITAPLIIALAHWVTEYGAIDNFTDCILDTTSSADPFYNWNSTEVAQNEIYNNPTGAISSDNSPEFSMYLNDLEQGDLFQEVWDFYNQFETAQLQVANGFNVETDLNDGLAASTNKVEVETVLTTYYTSNLCNYWLISGENRIHAIDVLCQGTPTNIQFKRIVDLTATAAANGQAIQVYNAIFENNGEIYWKVTNAMTSGINYSGYNDFVHALLNIALLTNPENSYIDSLGTTPYSPENINGSAVNLGNEVINAWSHTEHPTSNRLYFSSLTQYGNNVGSTVLYGDTVYCAPDEMIRVRMMDFSYEGNEQFYRDNGFLERDMVMPAFYLSYLDYQRQFANSMVAVNGIVDAIAIITAIPTAGTSTVAAVTISLATANIVVTANQQFINNASWGDEFMQAWTVIQLVDLGNGLFQIAKGITRKITSVATNFHLYPDAITDAMKSNDPVIRTQGKESYEVIRNALRVLGDNANAKASQLYQYVVQQLDAEYILNFKNSFNDFGFNLNFYNHHNLAIAHNGSTANILTLENGLTGPYLKGTIANAAPQNATLVSKIDDVSFRKNSSTNVEEGNLEIYRKADGSYVTVKSNVPVSPVTYFAKLDNNVANTLSSSELNTLQGNLSNQGLVRFDVSPNTFENPSTFLNETGNGMYEMVLDNDYYVKYDISTGKIFVSNKTTGEFYGFAQEKNILIIQPGQDPNLIISQHIQAQGDKIKTICGLNGNLALSIFGTNYPFSASKVSTALGRMDDINILKNVLGDFKNIDLGEIAGGINILNRPDVMWMVNPSGWWDNYNLPWIQRAINRSDDFYLVTAYQTIDDLDNLLRTLRDGQFVPTITAWEIKTLVANNIKPKNISTTKWDEITNIIDQMDQSGMF